MQLNLKSPCQEGLKYMNKKLFKNKSFSGDRETAKTIYNLKGFINVFFYIPYSIKRFK